MEIKENDTLILSGKTRKGKTRIKEYGSRWRILLIQDKVAFSFQSGPWLLLEPMIEDVAAKNNGSRWIHQEHDMDFAIASLH